MKKIVVGIMFLGSLIACKPSVVKEKINKAGDVAGQTAGEFFEGVSKGVQKAFDVDIDLPENLKTQGIEFGKSTISSDSVGSDNLLNLYVIFNKDFKGEFTAKVLDDKSKEMGRARTEILGKKGDAKFFMFHFDEKTNIDSKNKIVVQ
ncbi:MAG: hypothetical protein ACK5B9_15000 [Flavobacteriia bacterium]|jgi:hypothetical protein